MPLQQQFNNSTGLWEIQLADSTIVSSPTENCNQPFSANGYVVYFRCGHDNVYVARKLSNSVETTVKITEQDGGYSVFTNDSRYIGVANAVKQGKNFDPQDLVAMIFDTLAGTWLDFSAQPILNVFREVGGGAKPNCLWVKNGNQVGGFENSDPGGRVRRITWLSPGLLEWVTMQVNSNAVAVSYERYQRSITLSSGVMAAITQTASWPVNITAPTEPSWL